MPTLEHELRRYGSVLDAAAVNVRASSELVTAARPRRAVRASLVAVAVVVVVSLIAVFASARSTHEPTPATTPIVAPTTTSNPQVAAAVAAARRAAAKAWIAARGGHVVRGFDSVLDIAMSDRAIYTWSVYGPPGDVGTLSRIDRGTLHVNSGIVPVAGQHLSVVAGAVYLLSVQPRHPGLLSAQPLHPGLQLQRFDPDTLETMWTVPFADTSSTFGHPEVVGDGASIWVTVGHDIQQFDAASGRILTSVNETLPASHTGAFLALDPAGQDLYMAFGAGDGTPQPLQKLDPQTGKPSPLTPTVNERAAGGFIEPQLAATDSGVWLATQSEQSRGNVTASFYRANGLGRAATLTVGGTTGRGLGLMLTAAGSTLWDWNATFVACADSSTGRALASNRLGDGTAGSITADALAADGASVAVSVSGTLAIFRPGDLCRPAK